MRNQVKVKKTELLLSENLETIIREHFPHAKLNVSHLLNQIEITQTEIKTTIEIDNNLDLINVNSKVIKTGVNYWLLILLILPYRGLVLANIIPHDYLIEWIYYFVVFMLASASGRAKTSRWNNARERREKEMIKFIEKLNTDFELKEKSNLDTELYKNEFQSLIGKSIKEVNYFFANEHDYDHNSLHTLDLGISLTLENNNFISWIMKGKEMDTEENISAPKRYVITFTNTLEEKGNYNTNENVSENLNWRPFTTEPITDIKVYTQKVKKEKIVTDLIIETASNKVAIISIYEPIRDEEQLEIDFSIGNEWTAVLFDEEDIISNERIENAERDLL